MDRGAQWATVYRVAKSQTQLKRLSRYLVILNTSVWTEKLFSSVQLLSCV